MEDDVTGERAPLRPPTDVSVTTEADDRRVYLLNVIVF